MAVLQTDLARFASSSDSPVTVTLPGTRSHLLTLARGVTGGNPNWYGRIHVDLSLDGQMWFEHANVYFGFGDENFFQNKHILLSTSSNDTFKFEPWRYLRLTPADGPTSWTNYLWCYLTHLEGLESYTKDSVEIGEFTTFNQTIDYTLPDGRDFILHAGDGSGDPWRPGRIEVHVSMDGVKYDNDLETVLPIRNNEDIFEPWRYLRLKSVHWGPDHWSGTAKVVLGYLR